MPYAIIIDVVGKHLPCSKGPSYFPLQQNLFSLYNLQDAAPTMLVIYFIYPKYIFYIMKTLFENVRFSS